MIAASEIPHLRWIACSLIAIGLGWTFGEVRRFFFHTEEFVCEALHDHRRGRRISLVCGALFLIVGAFLAYREFGFGEPVLVPDFPYVVEGRDASGFVKVTGLGLAIWGVFSALSVRFLPPPLFSERVMIFLCRTARIGLFLVLACVVLVSLPRIGNNWNWDAIGIVLASLALLAIYHGALWSEMYLDSFPMPPVTCEERPFPYVISVLVLIGIAYLTFYG